MKLQGGYLVLLLIAFYSVNADHVLNYTGVYVKVLEKSGKIVVGNTSNVDADPNSVKLQFAEIKEKDVNGSGVGQNAVPPHNISTFENQTLSFSSTSDVTYKNITATMCNFTINLAPINAALLTSVYVFKMGGNITEANETTNIKAGNVKIVMTVMNWTFCGPSGSNCTGDLGQYIDFSIVISGNQSASNATNGTSDGDMYDLGAGTRIILSKKVKYEDQSWTNMTTGYPKTGGNQTFTFRFNKFNISAQYSLIVAVGGSGGENGNITGGNDTTVGSTGGTTGSGNGTTVSNPVSGNSGNTLSLSIFLAFLEISLVCFLLYM